jgi:hypothetical protein
MVCVGKTYRFSKFTNASQVKFWKSAVHRGRPEEMPKWKAAPAWKASGAMEKIRDVTKIAVDAKIQTLPATQCTIKEGSRRLMSPQNAELMIVLNAARLHACGVFDWQHLCDLIYIIGAGLPVVCASAWRLAGGRPSNLVFGRNIFLHAPATKHKPCSFALSSSLVEERPELKFALQHCAKLPRSKWKYVTDKGQPLAADVVRASNITQLAAAILKLRTLEADSCRGYMIAH